jgi:hypothetical protein
MNLASTEPLSLYNELSGRGYEASIIATYGLSGHLYERVVLRRLQSSGCRHNIVLVDAIQCARELASGFTGPRLCGSEYTLLPVSSSGAFHPKFIMLLGRKKSRLIVGSHNLTFAGFGINREITTAFDVEPSGPTIAALQAVWRFVLAWTAQFPSEIRDVVGATEQIAPWLTESQVPTKHSLVLCTLPTGTSLWDQVKPLLRSKVHRIFILSPYFDSNLGFLQDLEKELKPAECILAIHPQFTEMRSNAISSVNRCRFVDVAQLGDEWARRFLHAKVYRFELADGTNIMVTGSANASRPAWVGAPGHRNAEMVVVHQDGEQLWQQLGLSRLAEMPDVDEVGWEAMRLREAARKKLKDESYEVPFMATSAPEGFLVDRAFTDGVDSSKIRVLDINNSPTLIEKVVQAADRSLCVLSDRIVREAATQIEAVLPGGERRIAIVHHIEGLLDRAAGNVRQAFRRAFAGLEGDPDQLIDLIHVVERAIFDDKIPLEMGPQRRIADREKRGSGPNAVGEPTSLMISAKDTVRARRHRRLSINSDLAIIIDALIYRLGRGLQMETDSPASVRPPEDVIRDDDEPPQEVDGHALARLCRQKINRLFRRMVAQLELATKRGNDATTVIVQLSAVLGVVKHLRLMRSTFNWLPRSEELVDPDNKWKFFKEVARLLHAPAFRLEKIALGEKDKQDFDELTAVRGLLAWLAFDCGVDTRHALDHAFDDPKLMRQALTGIAYFLPVISECASDPLAAEMLKNVTAEQRGDGGTVAYHLGWARKLAKAAGMERLDSCSIALGDVVLPVKGIRVKPSVVLEVQHGKTGLVDLNNGELKYYAVGYLARIGGLRGLL